VSTGSNGESTSSWYSTDINNSSNSNIALNYESISFDERKTLLSQCCGVVSEHTKKACTRSKRCPQHTEEQRKHIREKFLGSFVNSQNLGSNYLIANQMHSNITTRSSDDSLITIDNCDDNQTNNELNSESVKTIWNEGLIDSREGSPADSSSTNTSTSSVKRKNESIVKSIGNRNSSKTKSRNSSKKTKQQINLNGVSSLSSSSSVSSGNDHII